MALAKEITKCPFCKESIAANAIRCKHCHADLVKPKDKKPGIFGETNTFRTGFLTGILFSLILTILLYYQFWVD